MASKTFSTGAIAKICDVATRTVSKWIDSGMLPGYRIPGSQDRRVLRDDLRVFLKSNNLPLGELEAEGWHQVLVVSANSTLAHQLVEAIGSDTDFMCRWAGVMLAVGASVAASMPDVVLVDLSVGRQEASDVVQWMRQRQTRYPLTMIALATEDDPAAQSWTERGFNHSFRQPVVPAELAEFIWRTVNGKQPKETVKTGRPGRPRVAAAV